MMSDASMRLHFMGVGTPVVEESEPPADRVLDGAPKFRTTVHYESPDGRLVAGIWEATVGTWKVAYDEWEWCKILSGRCVITPEGGEPRALGPGDSIVLEPGFAGAWSVLEDCSKDFVVMLPPPDDT